MIYPLKKEFRLEHNETLTLILDISMSDALDIVNKNMQGPKAHESSNKDMFGNLDPNLIGPKSIVDDTNYIITL